MLCAEWLRTLTFYLSPLRADPLIFQPVAVAGTLVLPVCVWSSFSSSATCGQVARDVRETLQNISSGGAAFVDGLELSILRSYVRHTAVRI
eukprot:5364638-Pyramimonas_sp.AAC.1